MVNILVVEDSSDDVFFMQLALRRSLRMMHVDVVNNGDKAMEYLALKGQEGALPDLILLDLTLPGRSGWNVLTAVKGDPLLAHIPVVVVSGSHDPRDVLQARELESAFYLVKPMDMIEFDNLTKVVEKILDERREER
jgi:CheY-like chemotaxis protein